MGEFTSHLPVARQKITTLSPRDQIGGDLAWNIKTARETSNMGIGVPQCTLRTYQPTPTTVRFTVSTRAAPERVVGQVKHYLLLAGRILIASILSFILWMKWVVLSQDPEAVPTMLQHSTCGQLALWTAEHVPSLYLLPMAFLITLAIVQRGYKG